MPDDKHLLACLAQEVIAIQRRSIPVVPRGSCQVAGICPVSRQSRRVDGEATAAEILRQPAHFGGRGSEAMQHQTANAITGLKKGFRALHVGGMFGHSVKYSVTEISHERKPEFSDTCRADTQVCPYQQTGLAPDGNSTEENPNFQIGSRA